MRTFQPVAVAAIAAALALSLSACKKKEETTQLPPPTPAAVPAPDVINVPVSVKKVTLSNKIDATTRQPAAAMDTFATGDTIYAVVETIGSGKTTLKSLWTYHKGDQSTQVNETVQEIDAAGPATTEFHISKPGGWPTGDYQVEVFVNGTSAGVHKFTVK
jgi:hypothetical protein